MRMMREIFVRGGAVLGDRLRDQRGQVLPFAVLLLCGVLILVFVALVGLGEGRVGVAALQTTADSAALAAADTAQKVGTAQVQYQSVICVQHYSKGHPFTYPCFPGPMRTVTVSNAVDTLQSGDPPGWAGEAGCSTAPEPTMGDAAGTFGPYCHGGQLLGESWQFNQNAAEIAAQNALDANLPTLGRYGTVTLQGIDLTDGSGRAAVTLSLDEATNIITRNLHQPVVLVMTGTTTPGAESGS